MDEDTAWKIFASSGSVSDYLTYCTAKREAAIFAEENHENQYGRSDFKRTDNRGTGQVTNYIDTF